MIAGGLVDLDNGLTGKLKNIVYTLLAFAVSSLAVEAVISRPAAYAAVMTRAGVLFLPFSERPASATAPSLSARWR